MFSCYLIYKKAVIHTGSFITTFCFRSHVSPWTTSTTCSCFWSSILSRWDRLHNYIKDCQTFCLICLSFPQFESGVLGCILLTISAVLSRSIDKYVELAQLHHHHPSANWARCVKSWLADWFFFLNHSFGGFSLFFFRVREDMDVPTTTLIGAHGYCTQVWHKTRPC